MASRTRNGGRARFVFKEPLDGPPVEIRKMVVTFDNGEKWDAIHKRQPTRFCLAVVAAKGLNKVTTYFLLCFPSSVCQTNGLN